MIKDDFKRIHQLSFPIFISYLTGIIFTFADNSIIGRYQVESYAIVTLVGSMMYYLIGSVGTFSLALTMKGTPLLDNQDYTRYERLLNTAIWVGLSVSLISVIFCIAVGAWLFENCFGLQGPTKIMAYHFLVVLSLSIPLQVLIFTFSSYFKSIEQPKILAYSTIIASIVNLVVNYLFVFGISVFPELGAIGVAVGTLCGLSVSVAIYLRVFLKQKQIRFAFIFNWQDARSMLSLFVTLFFQDLFEFTVFYFFILAVISSSGLINAATYGVLTTLFSILIMLSYAYGNTILVLAGKISTSGNRLISYTKMCLSGFILSGALYTLVLWTLGTWSASIITNVPSVIEQSQHLLLIFAVSQLFIGIATILRYLLNGRGLANQVVKVCGVLCSVAGILIYGTNQFMTLDFKSIILAVSLTYLLMIIAFLCLLAQTEVSEDEISFQ